MGVWMVGRYALHGTMALLFLLSAAVQLNDPDPLRWLAVYTLSAVLALQAARRAPGLRPLALLAALAALGGASVLAVMGGLSPIPPADLFAETAMKTAEIEAWREVLGLVWVGGYHLGLVLWLRPPRPGGGPAPRSPGPPGPADPGPARR